MDTNHKFDLTKAEFALTQQQMDKYDNLLAQIKTWTITLWAALSGWSFQSQMKTILLLSILITLVFWFLDALNKNFRQSYKKRRDEIAVALRAYFATDQLPADFISPDLPKQRTAEALKHLFQFHVCLLYCPLIIVSLILYYFVY